MPEGRLQRTRAAYVEPSALETTEDYRRYVGPAIKSLVADRERLEREFLQQQFPVEGAKLTP